MFLYSNYYMTTAKIRTFMKKDKIIEDCIEFVREDPNKPGPFKDDLFRLYLTLSVSSFILL